jgi:hypothetical protein
MRQELLTEVADVERGDMVTELKQLRAQQAADVTSTTRHDDSLHASIPSDSSDFKLVQVR